MSSHTLEALRMEGISQINSISISDENLLTRVVHAIRTLTCQKEFERIPGLAYTYEERLAEIKEAEADYKAGRTITSEELKKRMAAW